MESEPCGSCQSPAQVAQASAPATALSFTVSIRLLADCDVYRGHFPGDPVCPGVCNIETIKECAAMVIGRPLRIVTIKQCRLTAIATPTVCPELDIDIVATPDGTDTYKLQATMHTGDTTYMDFKGTVYSN